ncbi:hypothetical protein RHMOL_Rhmol05G0004700 [Rhododendron molle]|nr:hypothetical protein RHMOL_Rhmol05G0004700 [Rhododendron molle]
MKLRGLGQGFVKHIPNIGDGQGTFLWLHNWHPLYKLFGDRAPDNLDRNINAKASSIILNGQWNWPRPSSNLIQQIKNSVPSSLLPQQDRSDDIVWTVSPNGQ